MRVVLAGASGFLGTEIRAALEQGGHQVLPLSRRHGANVARMLRPADWLPWLSGADALVNAVGIIGQTPGQRFDVLHTAAPQACFQACQAAGVRRVIQISALGADEGAVSHYHRSKKAADDYLRSLALDSFVLRPSLVYGRGGTSAQLFQRVARLPVLPVVGDGAQALQPVHVADIAATVLACLAAPRAGLTLDIVGNETLGYGQWLQRLREAQGLPPAPLLHLPTWLVMTGVWLGQPLHPMLRPQNIQMLGRAYRADHQTWHAFLGRPALDFTPALLHAGALEALATSRVPAASPTPEAGPGADQAPVPSPQPGQARRAGATGETA